MKSKIQKSRRREFLAIRKNFKFIIGAFLVLFAYQAQAQISVSLNIGSRPNWGNHYHQEEVQYVYLPELECYYDNYEEVYIYFGSNGWCRSSYLPDYCRGYNIHRAPRVVIDYRGNCPWTSFDYHRNHYWRDNYRNYRQEYYGPNYNRRGNFVAVMERRDYRNYDNDRYERRDNNDNAYGHYKRDNDDDHREGRGRGHGRRD
jgi:hypothetical protein